MSKSGGDTSLSSTSSHAACRTAAERQVNPSARASTARMAATAALPSIACVMIRSPLSAPTRPFSGPLPLVQRAADAVLRLALTGVRGCPDEAGPVGLVPASQLVAARGAEHFLAVILQVQFRMRHPPDCILPHGFR